MCITLLYNIFFSYPIEYIGHICNANVNSEYEWYRIFQYTKKLDLNWKHDCNDSTICQPCPFIMVVMKNLTEQSPEVPKPSIVLVCRYNQTSHTTALPSNGHLQLTVLLYVMRITWESWFYCICNSHFFFVHRILCCVHYNKSIRSLTKMPRSMGIWYYLTSFSDTTFYFAYNARFKHFFLGFP